VFAKEALISWGKNQLKGLEEIVHDAHTELGIVPVLTNLTEKPHSWHCGHSEGFLP